MQLGMVGLGRMGANIVRRLMRDGHECVVFDISAAAVHALEADGAVAATSLADLASKLEQPRAVWIMVPAGDITTKTVDGLAAVLGAGDAIIDGGNSHYYDDLARAASLRDAGVHYIDVGTSGGVWGLDRGYCLMIGGDTEAVDRLDPIWACVAPGVDAAPRTAGRDGDPSAAEQGYLHCGPVGAGHFVKMVHNGIEYGLMAAYAEGLNILKNANVGSTSRDADAETAPSSIPSTTCTTSTSRRSPRSGGVAAWSSRGCSTSPPPRWLPTPTSTISPDESPTPARAAGPRLRPSTRAYPRLCWRRPCSPASRPATRTCLPIGSCPPCASSSAGTTRRGRDAVVRPLSCT